MSNRKHFQAWLRLARSFDWSFEQRDASCVRAFTALQRAMEKCSRNAMPLAQENTTAAANKDGMNELSIHKVLSESQVAKFNMYARENE